MRNRELEVVVLAGAEAKVEKDFCFSNRLVGIVISLVALSDNVILICD